MKYYRSGGIAPRIANLGTRRRWSSSRPCHFIPGKKIPRYPFSEIDVESVTEFIWVFVNMTLNLRVSQKVDVFLTG